jgi:hypothetical protein
MSSARFPPPWTVEEMEACFVVRDATRVTTPTKWTNLLRSLQSLEFIDENDCGSRVRLPTILVSG